MNVLVIRPGGFLEAKEIDDDFRAIQAEVGGTFESCFKVDGLIGFCDDEFLLRPEAPVWNVVPEPGVLRRDACAIGGPIVVVGCLPDGESRGLTTDEIGRFAIVRDPRVQRGIPTLTYRRTGAA